MLKSKKNYLLFVLLLLSTLTYGQAGAELHTQRFGNTWYFGETGLDFNCTPPRVLRLESKINPTTIGTSTLSDKCGDLLYYCNGDSIWNSFHALVNSPAIPLAGSRQSTQSSLILPNLQTPGTYYFFTVDGDEVNNFKGLSYSEMKIGSNPLFVVANKLLVPYTNEMVTATNDGQGGYWVVTKVKGARKYMSYHVTGTGVDTNAVVSHVGSGDTAEGQLKFSPDGRFLAVSRPLQIFKFDVGSGEIKDFTGPMFVGQIDPSNNWLDDGNAVEFSASGRFLYFNNYNEPIWKGEEGLFQLDLSTGDPATIEHTVLKITHPNVVPRGGMQLGPDGKIYVIESDVKDKLGIINLPEHLGSASNYVSEGIDLRLSKPGLYFPNFNQSWFYEPELFKTGGRCHADTTYFEFNDDLWFSLADSNKIDSVQWVVHDPQSGLTKLSGTNVKHYFSQPGCYNIQMAAYSSALGGSISRERLVRINVTPTTDLGPHDTTLCVHPRKLFRTVSTGNNPNSEYVWYYKSFADIAAGKPDLGIQAISFQPDYTMTDEGRFWVVKTYKCCSSSDSINVDHDSIFPLFKINDGVQCERTNNYVFTNYSTPIVQSASWDFGDGTKATGINTVKHYTNLGVYYPKMTVISAKGCVASMSWNILTVKHPVAKFWVDTLEQCFAGNAFNIIDSSYIEYGNGGIKSILFNKGLSASDTTTKKQFSVTYPKPGVYTISLMMNSSQDCKDTGYQQVRVFAQPDAGFTINDTSQCISINKFDFTDTSYTKTDPINYRWWILGDTNPPMNRTGLPPQFSHSYSKVDSFNVQLKVGTGPGCYDSSSRYVYVRGEPFVDFTINQPEQCIGGNKFDFFDTTHVEGGIVNTFLWNFGDSTPISGIGKGKKYKNYGGFDVQLKVITNYGCTDSVSKSVVVDPMPKAAFTTSPQAACFIGHEFLFSGSPAYVNTGSIVKYHWEFGDMDTSANKNPTPKTYLKDTTHKVSLVVVSDKNCSDTVTKTVSFYPTPTANASVNKPIQCIEGNIFDFRGDSSVANGGYISSYFWEYGDGTIGKKAQPEGKQYISSDTFDVVLTVTTDKGCTNTDSLKVQVLPSPTANFSVEPTCLFQPSLFKNKSNGNPGKIVDWDWELGDGTHTSDSIPQHTYGNMGAYTVSLNVVSSFGCKATVTKVNEAIVKSLPEGRFGYEKTYFDEKNTTIQFADSSIDADNWMWDLGNGTTSTQQNPLIVFTDTATLNIKLVIGNAEGCFDTVRKTVFVAPDFFFHIPNAFTPNNDGLNSEYGGEGTIYYKEYNLTIFNRWGQMVFESNSPLKTWDGKHNGVPCPDGAYTYMYRLRDVFGYYHNYTGTVTLIR